MPEIDPKAYWPLIRFRDHDFDDDPAADQIMLRDGEMILLRVVLRHVCGNMPADDRLGAALEGLRHKIETVLDCEFGEGRFAELGPPKAEDKP